MKFGNNLGTAISVALAFGAVMSLNAYVRLSDREAPIENQSVTGVVYPGDYNDFIERNTLSGIERDYVILNRGPNGTRLMVGSIQGSVDIRDTNNDGIVPAYQGTFDYFLNKIGELNSEE
jgi:hypothetical protein